MKTKKIFEKFDAINGEVENLKRLRSIIEHSNANYCYFEFVENYTPKAIRIEIPRKHCQRLIDFIGQIADETEKELEKELSQFNK